MTKKQKVFLSYVHTGKLSTVTDKNDAEYKNDFVKMYLNDENITISSFLEDELDVSSTVTIVLIGDDTLVQKYVLDEISFSLDSSRDKTKNGVLGIILPSYTGKLSKGLFPYYGQVKLENSTYCIDENILPEEMSLEIKNGSIKLYDWSNNPSEVEKWIHEAFEKSLNLEKSVS